MFREAALNERKLRFDAERKMAALERIRKHSGHAGVLNALQKSAKDIRLESVFGWDAETDRQKARDMADAMDELIALLQPAKERT